MKKNLVLFLSFLISVSVFAQTSSTSSGTSSIFAPIQTPWVFQFKNDTFNTLETTKIMGGATTENQFKLTNKINSSTQIGFLVGFKYDLANTSQNQADIKTKMNDFALDGILETGSLLGSDKTVTEGRIYIPTSEKSHVEHLNTQLRADVLMPYTLKNNMTAYLYFNPRLYNYENGLNITKLRSQARIGIGSTLHSYVALDHKIEMGTKVINKRTLEAMGPEVGIEWTPNSFVKLAFNVAQFRNVLNPTESNVRKNIALFDTKESEYDFMAQIKY